MTVRSFLALDVDAPIRRALIEAAQTLPTRKAKLRPVAEENLHVTLHFLGDVAEELLNDVLTVARRVASGIGPFDFQICGLAAMPPRGGVRMVWANVVDPTGRMKQLHQRLAEALSELGVPIEARAFRPHITLVRVKFADHLARIRDSVEPLAEKDFGTQHAEQVTAYASQLSPTGPVYTPLARCRLGE